MNTFFLIGLWGATALCFYKWRETWSYHPHRILRKIFLGFSHASPKKVPLLKRLGQLKWFARPGWIVGRLVTPQALEPRIKAGGNKITFEEFRTVKQMIVSVFFWYFWLFLFLGDVTGNNVLSLLFCFGMLFIMPDLWLRIQKEKRELMFSRDVPYFIDLLSLILDTGMNIEQALRYIAQHQTNGLTHEVKARLKDLDFGKSLEEVLEDLRQSIDVDEFQNFISSVRQAKTLGVSLSQTLELQSELIRTRRRQKAEELSRTAAVKISLPLVLFIFPALLLIYLGPGVMMLMSG